MFARILIILYCLFFCSVLKAQDKLELLPFYKIPFHNLKVKKANNLYTKAIKLCFEKENILACNKMEQSIKKNPLFSDAYSQLGRWYFESHEFYKASLVFKKALQNCPNGKKQFAQPYVQSLLYSGETNLALAIIDDNDPTYKSEAWGLMREKAYFIKNSIANEEKQLPISLVKGINTQFPELFPSVTIDTDLFYFTRRDNTGNEDLYIAKADDSCFGWKSIQKMGSPPNSPSMESAQFISADGHYLFFTRCENRSENGWAEGGCDLFMAYRISKDSAWTIPQPFGATINTPAYEGMPTLSADNKELYFVSDREGGYGGLDIWISKFENGAWQLPVNAGGNINTAGNETAPFINIDNQTLYFSSNGHIGMGGYDLYMCKRIKDTVWSNPRNLGSPINTVYDEMSTCVSLDGKILFFASDRNGPAGDYDIFVTPIPELIKPVPVSYIKGYVYDSITKDRLNYASIYIINALTGDTLYKFQSNRGDGSFIITLPLENTYALSTFSIGHQDTYDTFNFDKQYVKVPMKKNIVMLPSDYKEIKPISDSLILRLHFGLNKIELTERDKMAIHTALAPWVDEKGIILSVFGYTDNTGTPMLNEELSYKRADLVAKEVVLSGFNELQVQAKGWGEANNIADNKEEEGRNRNRRVELIIKR